MCIPPILRPTLCIFLNGLSCGSLWIIVIIRACHYSCTLYKYKHIKGNEWLSWVLSSLIALHKAWPAKSCCMQWPWNLKQVSSLLSYNCIYVSYFFLPKERVFIWHLVVLNFNWFSTYMYYLLICFFNPWNNLMLLRGNCT